MTKRFASGRLGVARFLLALVILAGCASNHHGFQVVENPPAVAGATTVNMLTVTTRSAEAGGDGCRFSGERGRERELCNLVVSIPPDKNRKAGAIQWSAGTPDPKVDFVTVRAVPMERDDLDDWFRAVASKKRRLFVFVHGFNTNFDEGVYRVAQIVHDSRMDAAPVLFSWPSRGGAFSYLYDTASAAYSRDALAYVLERAASDPNVTEMTVMAHSLGNFLMIEALRQMAIRDGHISPKIKNVIMAAPDLDVDLFRSQLLQMGTPLPRTTIFLSRDDRALAVSRIIAGGIDRLGAANAELPKYSSQLERFNLEVIDLTKVEGGDSLHHGKFAASPEVVRLIGKRLIDGQPIEGADLTSGERLIDGRSQRMSLRYSDR